MQITLLVIIQLIGNIWMFLYGGAVLPVKVLLFLLQLPVTDIAHLNGVKVLGQVFFPPSAFGGQQSWVIQMLTKEGDAYPYAKKLYDIAKYYGFDGWFINEETGWRLSKSMDRIYSLF